MKTDAQLLADLQAELSARHASEFRDVVLEAHDGVVTLAGHVGSYADRLAAEAVVKKVAGTRGVANEIDVRPSGSACRSDRDIVAAAVHALKSNVSVPSSAVTVVVQDGWITLEGKVALWYQKDAAETAVSSLWGVRGVSNRIELQPAPSASDIQQKIRRSFERLGALEADHVTIEVLDGIVTLNGQVDSWHERDEAARAAWSAPGVTNVLNRLTVRP